MIDMKFRPVLRFHAALLVLAVFQYCIPGAHAVPAGDWYKSFAQATKEARKTGRPILADFGASYCSACRKLESSTLKDPELASRLDRFIRVYVDTTEQSQLVRRFGIEALPTLITISPEGEELHRSVGYIDSSTLASTLDRAISVTPAKPKLLDQLVSSEGKPASSDSDKPASASEKKQDTRKATASTKAAARKPAKEKADAQKKQTVKKTGKSTSKDKAKRNVSLYDLSGNGRGGGDNSAGPDGPSDEPAALSSAQEITADLLPSIPENEVVIAQAEAMHIPDLPRPLIDAGSTRDSGATAIAPKSSSKSSASPPAEAKATPSTKAAAKAAAKKSDALATVRRLAASEEPAEAKPATDKAKAEATPAAKPVKATPAAKPAKAVAAPAKVTPRAVAKVTPESGGDAAAEPRRVSVKSRESADGSSDNIPSGERRIQLKKNEPEAETVKARSGVATAADIQRWMKDADAKLNQGKTNEARAMYAKVVEHDPTSKHGMTDLAFVKMVSLMVDRDDDRLRNQAYQKITEFLSRFPQSANTDYYTVIRATLAADLGKNDEAHALLDDFPVRFPQSKYTPTARQIWKSLPAPKIRQ